MSSAQAMGMTENGSKLAVPGNENGDLKAAAARLTSAKSGNGDVCFGFIEPSR